MMRLCADGHYMIRLGETKEGATAENEAHVPRKWAKGWKWVTLLV